MADTITYERMQELMTLYNNLKVKVEAVDRKYSLDYREPMLDMPESLNLPKLTFTPKTEEQLTLLANQQADATYIAKQRQLDVNRAQSLQNISQKYSELDTELETKSQALLTDYNAACDKLKIKLINNGLMYSTVNSRATQQARADYDQAVRNLNADNANKREQIDDRLDSVEAVYVEACNSLEQEKQATVVKAYNKLVDTENKEKQSVDKYNAKLDEKEVKYQASRARAIEYAWEAEYDRAFAAIKLYQQMGATGFADMKAQEKLNLCKQEFMPLRRNEAETLRTVDSFLQSHLGSYYSTFVDWINYALIA